MFTLNIRFRLVQRLMHHPDTTLHQEVNKMHLSYYLATDIGVLKTILGR